mmetsp:Transcript_16959/g.46299  ORF Transcript_16959/g.46299 Transcript_16959/m.46299 type:complete len:339 (-) Transcript_16959:109-1125(-)
MAAADEGPSLKRRRVPGDVGAGRSALQGLLLAFAESEEFGIVTAVADAAQAERELRAAQTLLRLAATRARLARLVREWDSIIFARESVPLRFVHARSSGSLDGTLEWASWSEFDELRLERCEDRVLRTQMELERELVTRLAGKKALQQPWLGRLPWLDEATSNCEDEFGVRGADDTRSYVAEEQRELLSRVVEEQYRRCAPLEFVRLEDRYFPQRGARGLAPGNPGDIIDVTIQLRVARDAVFPAVPLALERTLGEGAFCARVASGLRYAAAVAFTGRFPRTAGDDSPGMQGNDICDLICRFIPKPEEAVSTLSALASARRRRAALFSEEAVRIAIQK